MSRSMSTSSSDSSHDSESPRKREASGIDDAMELDEPPVPEVHVMPCEHLKALETSPNILLNYQKALKWSGAGAYGRGLRRRKVSFSLLVEQIY
ncbi:hypothetical protein FRC19_006311 [Serendipita sp. 401]|nr:hypothetical protein FRC19_006311 [Serendipita sp. 401]KAG9055687.1 hypothetical protein FS842_001494 [Serendipita sp. 407]